MEYTINLEPVTYFIQTIPWGVWAAFAVIWFVIAGARVCRVEKEHPKMPTWVSLRLVAWYMLSLPIWLPWVVITSIPKGVRYVVTHIIEAEKTWSEMKGGK